MYHNWCLIHVHVLIFSESQTYHRYSNPVNSRLVMNWNIEGWYWLYLSFWVEQIQYHCPSPLAQTTAELTAAVRDELKLSGTWTWYAWCDALDRWYAKVWQCKHHEGSSTVRRFRLVWIDCNCGRNVPGRKEWIVRSTFSWLGLWFGKDKVSVLEGALQSSKYIVPWIIPLKGGRDFDHIVLHRLVLFSIYIRMKW